MAVLNVVLYPDDPLTQVAKPFDVLPADIAELARDMFDTMDAYDGIGLAGPQIGLAKRIIAVAPPKDREFVLINPEIVESDGREYGEEGCLSIPRVYADVPRAARIRVTALDTTGRVVDFTATDLLARVIQHEIDHLNGILFIDRLDLLTRQQKLAEWDEVRKNLSVGAG